jgi:hypothetical protein
LSTLYSTGVHSRHIPAWVRIADVIAAHYPQFCQVLTAARRFSQFENAAGKLFLGISSDDYLGDPLRQVVQWSLGLLFKAPSNSFLHNFVVRALRLLAEDQAALSEVIKQTDLVGQRIVNYPNSPWDGRAFWGQLREFSHLITPCVNPREYPDWACVVAKSNDHADEVVNQRDGISRVVPWLPSSTFLGLFESPTMMKFLIWMIALVLLFMVYGIIDLSV